MNTGTGEIHINGSTITSEASGDASNTGLVTSIGAVSSSGDIHIDDSSITTLSSGSSTGGVLQSIGVFNLGAGDIYLTNNSMISSTNITEPVAFPAFSVGGMVDNDGSSRCFQNGVEVPC